ncbi:MAG: porin [Planctomycetaceae bacterium]|jgi:hypothetical protein|nr:porin [Planctomycetaceae bacterium]
MVKVPAGYWTKSNRDEIFLENQKMTKIFTTTERWFCLAALMFAFSPLVQADIFCNPCEPINCNTSKSQWDFGGWIDAGVMLNQYGQKDTYDTSQDDEANNNYLVPGNTGHLKNVKHSSFQMNQLWLYGEKKRDRHTLDIGGRVEFMYGVDGRHFQAFGLDRSNTTGTRWGSGDYYASLPQMYAEVGYGDFSIKTGKFFTVMGLDSSCAPNRFFYSTSFENQTYIDFGGVLATWDMNKNFTVFGGWVNGEERFFTDDKYNAFLGGMNWKVSPRFSLDYSVLIGKNDDPLNNDAREYFVNSLVARLKLSNRWDYAAAWLLRNEKGLGTDSGVHRGRYGINQELFYTVNCRWKLGLGAEWLSHYDSVTPENYDVYSFRLGANWMPNDRFTLRPELRYDKFEGARPFNAGTESGQFLYGFSGVMTF